MKKNFMTISSNKFKNKSIILAPYNNIARKFEKYINSLEINCKVVGFVDNNQNNENCFKALALPNLTFDYIVILSPQYSKEIFINLKPYINSKDIFFSHIEPLLNSCEPIIFSKQISYFLYMKYIKLLNLIFIYKNIDYVKLMKLKNKYKSKNKRAFIIGNGPSLNINDLELLENEITFAANKIYLCFNETNWRPTYYFVVDNLVYNQNLEDIKELNLVKFFSIDLLNKEKRVNNGIYFNIDRKENKNVLPNFSTNPFYDINKGNTVVYAMMQFAVYMGIKEIYFLGMDFNFQTPLESDSVNKNQLISSGEINHFHKDYRKSGEKWNTPNMEGLEKSFKKVLKYSKENNIKVYNTTRGGKLEILPRIDFDSLFKSY